MTRRARFAERMSPFSHWLRALAAPLDSTNFSAHNLDFIWHQYRDNWLITMEEKQYGGKCTTSQGDTHRIVSQMLEYASGMVVETLRGRRPAEYRGHYVIRLANTSPEDSEWIEIASNGKTAMGDKSLVLRLLAQGTLEELQ